MESITEGLPPLEEDDRSIASLFGELAEDIKKRQQEDADAAQVRQTELKQMYSHGQRNGVIWGLIFCLVVGGSLFWFARSQESNNEDLSKAVKDLAAASARKTPVLDYIVCHDTKSDDFMVTLGTYLQSLIDNPEDQRSDEAIKQITQNRRDSEEATKALSESTAVGVEGACPVAPNEGG